MLVATSWTDPSRRGVFGIAFYARHVSTSHLLPVQHHPDAGSPRTLREVPRRNGTWVSPESRRALLLLLRFSRDSLSHLCYRRVHTFGLRRDFVRALTVSMTHAAAWKSSDLAPWGGISGKHFLAGVLSHSDVLCVKYPCPFRLGRRVKCRTLLYLRRFAHHAGQVRHRARMMVHQRRRTNMPCEAPRTSPGPPTISTVAASLHQLAGPTLLPKGSRARALGMCLARSCLLAPWASRGRPYCQTYVAWLPSTRASASRALKVPPSGGASSGTFCFMSASVDTATAFIQPHLHLSTRWGPPVASAGPERQGDSHPQQEQCGRRWRRRSSRTRKILPASARRAGVSFGDVWACRGVLIAPQREWGVPSS